MENPAYEDRDAVPEVGFSASGPQPFPVVTQPQSPTNGDAGIPQPTIQYRPSNGGPPTNDSLWMSRPEDVPHECPQGLEYLTQLNQVVLRRQLEFHESKTAFGHWNKYKVMNPFGQLIYSVQEESSSFERNCCSRSRGFVMHIMDYVGREVIRVRRDFKPCGGCWCSCLSLSASTVTVEAPVGVPVGYVTQERSIWQPYFSIKTAQRHPLAYIRGPGCVCSGPCCADPEFDISSVSDGSNVGRVAQRCSSLGEGQLARGDDYTVTFPMDMDVKMKAVFLGAAFLLRAMVPRCKLGTDPSYSPMGFSSGMGLSLA